jgi:hypothetical protein
MLPNWQRRCSRGIGGSWGFGRWDAYSSGPSDLARLTHRLHPRDVVSAAQAGRRSAQQVASTAGHGRTTLGQV